jgi:hypothetical protein
MDEVLRGINAPVDMGFRGKVDDGIKRVLGHQSVHLVDICNIGFEKFVTLAMFLRYAVEVGEVSGVREDVDVTH